MEKGNAGFRDHKDLEAWKRAMQLAKDVYSVSAGFPREEQFGMVSQLRRAAVSVPSNIAEGAARNSDKELIRFLSIAMGSVAELETQMLLAKEFGYLRDGTIFSSIEAARKPLSGLIKYLKNKGNQ
jgi:four helix bundle protein